MSVAPREDIVGVGQVDQRTSFDAVFVAHIKADIVFDIELPESFMVLEGEA